MTLPGAKIIPKVKPELDPGFVPAALWNRAYREMADGCRGARSLAIALEQPGGNCSVFETRLLPHESGNISLNERYAERLVKFLIWQRGGCRLYISAPVLITEMLKKEYCPEGARAFDCAMMGEKFYGQPFEIQPRLLEAMPVPKKSTVVLGNHWDGCRIGFDLGGSDRKCAAVRDGKVVFSEEAPWNPCFQKDWRYHLEGIQNSLRRAAAHLPRVDAIGGSAAGVYVNNEVRAASLFRGVSPGDFDRHVRRIFLSIQKKWNGVPLVVLNDGEVTALAGAMSLDARPLLGLALGTSQAAGYVNTRGRLTSWLNELAFAPVDYRENAPPDEWSGDTGCGAQYFSQQAASRLAPRAGIHFPDTMPLPEQLEAVQERMARGDERAARIYRTIGVCLGYALGHYADFYEFGHVLILGRVTSGGGGGIILEKAREVLELEFPGLRGKIVLKTPGEKEKRHGQAAAVATLPALPEASNSPSAAHHEIAST